MDFFILVVRAGITLGSQDHTNRGTVVPLRANFVQTAIHSRLQQRNQLAFQSHHDRLALRIAEARIELQDFGAVPGNHKTDVDYATVTNVLLFEPGK